jgi:uncharacterized protein (DUF433 family)
MNLPWYLTRHEKGEIRLAGHRIDLYEVISRYHEGDSAGMIRDRYPTLDVDLIREVIAFYRENKAGVEAYMEDVRARIEQTRAAYEPGPGILRIRELREERIRAGGAS